MPIQWVWVQVYYAYRYRHATSTGTGVALAILHRSKSQLDGSIHSARRFRTLVGSGRDVDCTEKRKVDFRLSIAG